MVSLRLPTCSCRCLEHILLYIAPAYAVVPFDIVAADNRSRRTYSVLSNVVSMTGAYLISIQQHDSDLHHCATKSTFTRSLRQLGSLPNLGCWSQAQAMKGLLFMVRVSGNQMGIPQWV